MEQRPAGRVLPAGRWFERPANAVVALRAQSGENVFERKRFRGATLITSAMGSTTPAPVREVIELEKEQTPPLWWVVLLDDDEHTYDYVIEMLMKLFLKTADEAYSHAVEVDTMGRTVVMICEREAAEFARNEIHGYGADWRLPRSKGSMSATLEHAPGSGVA